MRSLYTLELIYNYLIYNNLLISILNEICLLVRRPIKIILLNCIQSSVP